MADRIFKFFDSHVGEDLIVTLKLAQASFHMRRKELLGVFAQWQEK